MSQNGTKNKSDGKKSNVAFVRLRPSQAEWLDKQKADGGRASRPDKIKRIIDREMFRDDSNNEKPRKK